MCDVSRGCFVSWSQSRVENVTRQHHMITLATMFLERAQHNISDRNTWQNRVNNFVTNVLINLIQSWNLISRSYFCLHDGGYPGQWAGVQPGQDLVLSVRDSHWSQPCQPVRGVSEDTGGHHRGNTQAGQYPWSWVTPSTDIVWCFRWRYSTAGSVRDISSPRVSGYKQRWRAESWWRCVWRSWRGWRM